MTSHAESEEKQAHSRFLATGTHAIVCAVPDRAIIASMDRADVHAHPHHHHGAGHSHDISADADRRYLTIAFLLITGFMVFEVIAGILAHSLALLSDAAHMLTDAGRLALSLTVIRFVQRPAAKR
jgi:cobalt-zinc-cadmium efflux system protein